MAIQRQVMVKNLSGLGGVKDVSFGPATPERRANRDLSKSGIPEAKSDTFDDYVEREQRWSTALDGM